MTRAQRRLQTEARRLEIARRYLGEHKTEEAIGRELGMTQQAVSLHVLAILAQYRKAREELIDREAAGLDEMETAAAARSAADREWMETRLRIKKQRAELLGLNAPKKSEVRLTTQDIDATIERELAELVTGGEGTPPGQDPAAEAESLAG
jgi:hypothetical protein